VTHSRIKPAKSEEGTKKEKMANEKKFRVLIDMDGVLCDWERKSDLKK